MSKKINSVLAALVVAAVLIAAYCGVIFAVQKNSNNALDINKVTAVDKSTTLNNAQNGSADGSSFVGCVKDDGYYISGIADNFDTGKILTVPVKYEVKYVKFETSFFRELNENSVKLGFESESPYYTIKDNVLYNKDKTTLLCYFNDSTKAVIPDSVCEIGDYAFYKSKITDVKIPNSVKTIGKEAFADCMLKEADLPEGLQTIGQKAFLCESLTKITIPSTVTSCGNSVVGSSDNFKELNINCSYDAFGDYGIVYFGFREGSPYYFDGNYTVNSKEVFYPCRDLYFLLSADKITVNEPCKEKDFDPLKYGDELKKVTNNACEIKVIQKGNPTKIRFKFAADVNHECIVTLNFK